MRNLLIPEVLTRMTPERVRRTQAAIDESERQLAKFQGILAQEAKSMYPDLTRIAFGMQQVEFLTGHIAKLEGCLK